MTHNRTYPPGAPRGAPGGIPRRSLCQGVPEGGSFAEGVI
jgi:hypothetical protein